MNTHIHKWQVSCVPYAHAWCSVWDCDAQISDEEIADILNGKLQVSDFQQPAPAPAPATAGEEG